MLRPVAVALASVFVLAGVHAPAEAGPSRAKAQRDAEREAPQRTDTAKRRAKAKKTASKRRAKHRKKHRAKRRANQRAKTSKKGRSSLVSRRKRPKVKTTNKPLVEVATLQSDGRVRYGPDRMPPGFAWPPTKQMQVVSKSCEDSLDALGVVWKPASKAGWVVDPIVVPSMEIGGIKYRSAYRRGPHTFDCQFVHALALIGPELHALGVREVTFGSVVRTTMARSHGQTKEFRSRHALGIAMDIKAFVDASGRVAKIDLDYLKGDPLLHGVEDAINRNVRFRQVLTPGNDPISHYDHFHIEASVDFTASR